MRHAVVDFQGFISDVPNGEGKDFIIKELSCVMLTDKMEMFNKTFQSPYPIEYLSKKVQKTASYVTKNHHLLSWNDGLIPYDELSTIVKKLCEKIDLFYIKGLEKLLFFQKILNNFDHRNIIECRLISDSFLKINDISNYLHPVCEIKQHKFNMNSICALRNAYYYGVQMKKFFCELERIKTFENLFYPEEMSSVLAANGFYLILQENKVFCFWCANGFVFNKRIPELIIQEHYLLCCNICCSFNSVIPNKLILK